MFRKRVPFYIISDHKFNKKKRRINRLFRFAYLSTIVISLIFSKSLLFIVLTIFILMLIKKFGVMPNYHHQIQLYSDSFSYISKRKVYSLEYGSVSFIDQDIYELSNSVHYNKLTLLDEQMDTLITIDGRNFDFDDLVSFCQFIQDTNLSSRNNYYNRDEQFLAAVTDMDMSIVDR